MQTEMKSTREETPRREPGQDRSGTRRAAAETTKPGVTVRVSVLHDHRDDEEHEAGYGHGV